MDLHAIRKATGYEKRTAKGIPEGSCLLCGRKVNPEGAHAVGMNFDGTLTLAGEAEQGFFDVGPECWRKYMRGG